LAGPYALGDTVTVNWTANEILAVTVAYSDDGTNFSLVTTAAPQNGPYNLLLDNNSGPQALNIDKATINGKVKIYPTSDSTVSSTSAHSWSPSIAVTAPPQEMISGLSMIAIARSLGQRRGRISPM